MERANRSAFGVVTALVCCLASAASLNAGPIGSIFNPNDYTSLGALELTSGSYTIDTNALTISGTAGNGVFATNQSGLLEAAVFSFDFIDVATGVTIDVIGDRALVLASRSSFNFDGTLNIAGGDGSGANPGNGGSGAEGGQPGVSFNSNTGFAMSGDGGAGSTDPTAADGFGYGASTTTSNSQKPGAGASYGGQGGNAASGTGGGSPSTPGITYGDPELNDLFGGSGGAGGTHSNNASYVHGGGGGGGAVEFVATEDLVLGTSAVIDASGGAGSGNTNLYHVGGGGGSGGGVLLAGGTVSVTGTIDVSGGDGGLGGEPARHAGGGGGGRIAIYGDDQSITGSLITSGGTAGADGQNGSDGTVFSAPSVRHAFQYQQDGSEDASGVQTGVSYSAPATYIRNDSGGPDSTNDNDPQNEVIAGYNSSVNSQLRSMFEFDLSDAAPFADARNVIDASFTLNAYNGQGASGLQLQLYHYEFDFDEATATWNDPDGDGNAATGDTTPGGTLGSLLGTVVVNPASTRGEITWTDSEAFRQAIAEALASADPTLRLLVVPFRDSDEQSFIRLSDESTPNMAERPQLTFTLVSIPEPATLVAFAAGAAMLRRRR